MNSKTRKIFAATLMEVLEQFGYVLGDEANLQDCLDECSTALAVSMTYSGPAKGIVTLVLSTSLARTVAANTLGVDPSRVKPADAEDTAKELLNVFTGKLCHELHGPKEVSELTVPVLRRFSKKECGEFCRHRDIIYLAVEGAAISGRLSLK